MDTINATAIGTSPQFTVTAEEFELNLRPTVTRIRGDHVEPPILGPEGSVSEAMGLLMRWHPWADEKLVEPKFDGVAQFLGQVSNRPTPVRDYHAIALLRAVDYILAPRFKGFIIAEAGSVTPSPPPTP